MKTKRSLFQNRQNNNIRAATEADTIYLYDEISWWGILADDFIKDLNAMSGPVINLRINSPGGHVFEGVTIANAIRNHSAKVIAHIDGLAASIASIIAIAADEVVMNEGAFMMIHNPWTLAVGDAAEMRKTADRLDKIGESLAGQYVRKTGLALDEVLQLLDEETWLNAEEAVEKGFANRLGEEKPIENSFDLSVFQNVPKSLQGQAAKGVRDFEKSLREAGYSRSEAKRFVAAGQRELNQRDADDDISPNDVDRFIAAMRL